MTDRALILCRQSVTERGDVSLDAQEERCRAYCHDRGYAIIGVSREESTRGWRDDREAIAAAIEQARARAYSVLVAWDVSRVARSVRILENLLHDLDQFGVRLESVSESWVSDPLMRQVLSAFAEKTTRDIARNVVAAKARMAHAGRWHGGPAPYGYQLVKVGESPSILLPDSVEAAIVTEIYERYTNGEPVMSIIRSLHERGIRGRRSPRWTTKTLFNLLRNPVYLGAIAYKGNVVYPEAHPPIIERDLFDRAQRITQTRPVVHYRPDRPGHWLAGYVYHSCGHRMYLMVQRHPEMKRGHQLYYRCRGRIGLNDDCTAPRATLSNLKLGKAARACLRHDLANVECLADALERAETHAGGYEVIRQREALELRRSTAMKRYERVREAWADGDEPLDWLDAERDRRDAILQDVADQIAALPETPDPAVFARVAATLSSWADIIDALEDDDLTPIIAELGRVVVSGEGVTIQYHQRYRDFVPEPMMFQVV